MHEELVDRLKDTLKAYAVRLPLSSCLTIQEAISALTAPQAETCEHGIGNIERRILNLIEDLKVGLATLSEDGQRVQCAQIGTLRYVAGMLDDERANATHWTRKDGTTTPERGGEERRRHPHSMGFFASNRRLEHRRSGDAARWTAPVQETPQTLEYSDGDRFRELMLAPEASAHLFTLLAQGKGDKAAFVKMLDRIMDSRRSAVK